MRLLHLTVHNVGVFAGLHRFDFTPVRKPDGSWRHVTIVGGQNGVGKSTLFSTLSLALHGALALGDRVSRQEYNAYLLNRLHRSGSVDMPALCDEASVRLAIEYVRSGHPLTIEIERRWVRRGASVSDDLDVWCAGQPPDVDRFDYQTWLNDLIPPGLTALCFFDAERLDALAATEDGSLGVTVRRLLGLDLVERLQADLERFTLGQGGGGAVIGRQRANVVSCQAAVDVIEAELADVDATSTELRAERERLEAQLAEQERQFSSEGGGYAERRDALRTRLTEVRREAEAKSEVLRDMAEKLLPFALAPDLCGRLARRLSEERERRRYETAATVWDERLSDVVAALHTEEVWAGTHVAHEDRRLLTERLAHAFRMQGSPATDPARPFIHPLSDREQEQLERWIIEARHVLSDQAIEVSSEIRTLQAEARRIEADLDRVPDNAAIVPLQEAIADTREALVTLQKEQAALSERRGALQFRHTEAAARCDAAVEQLRRSQVAGQQVELAERSRLVLRAYEDALTLQRITAFEETLVTSFNAICRKEHLLEAVHISPDDWSIELYSADQRLLRLNDFSAGERQLYALALLWALRQVSGQQLPLVIDTPFARLDEVHRLRVAHDYIPTVSDQVLLLATSAEFDGTLTRAIEPYVARSYRLDYDPTCRATHVTGDGLALVAGESIDEVLPEVACL